MTPKEICQRYRNALRALYGDERAEASRVDYDKGWYYINVARRYGDGSIGCGGVTTSAYRKSQVVEMTEELEKRAKKNDL